MTHFITESSDQVPWRVSPARRGAGGSPEDDAHVGRCELGDGACWRARLARVMRQGARGPFLVACAQGGEGLEAVTYRHAI